MARCSALNSANPSDPLVFKLSTVDVSQKSHIAVIYRGKGAGEYDGMAWALSI
jgi:hypothetical protein